MTPAHQTTGNRRVTATEEVPKCPYGRVTLELCSELSPAQADADAPVGTATDFQIRINCCFAVTRSRNGAVERWLGMRHLSVQVLAVLAALAAIVVSAPAPAAASTTDGLVGYWPLNEAAGTYVHDASGYGNDGQLSGAAAWATGAFGSGLNFGPATGQVQVVDAPSLEPASTVTVSAWVNHLGSPGLYRYIVAKGATGCIAASYGLYSGPEGGLQFYISRQHGTTYLRSADAGAQVWDGRWHLVVGTFDGSDLRLYIDGSEIGSAESYPGPLVYELRNSNDLFIGNYPGCAQHGFVGSIDEVRIWDRALSPQEVQALAPAAGQGPPSAPAPTPPPAPSPVAQPQPIGGVAFSGTPPASSPAKARQLRRRWPGLVVTYTDSRGGRTTLTLYGLVTVTGCSATQARSQHRVASRHRVRAHTCTRSRLLGRFTHRDRRGRNRVRIDRKRTLRPGRYRLVITLDAGRSTARSKTVYFRLRDGRAAIRIRNLRRR